MGEHARFREWEKRPACFSFPSAGAGSITVLGRGMRHNEKNGNNMMHGKNTSHASQEPLLRPRGDYRTLLSFQKAEVIYDITFRFAHKFLAR